MPVHQFVPQRHLGRLLHHRRLQRQQPGEGAVDPRGRLGTGRADRPSLPPRRPRLVFPRQRDDAGLLQRLQQPQRRLDAVRPARGVPAQMLADGVQLATAAGKSRTVFWAICRRVRRQPKKVVDLSVRIASSTGASQRELDTPIVADHGHRVKSPGAACATTKQLTMNQRLMA